MRQQEVGWNLEVGSIFWIRKVFAFGKVVDGLSEEGLSDDVLHCVMPARGTSSSMYKRCGQYAGSGSTREGGEKYALLKEEEKEKQ